ncbi:MAG: phosphoribosylglycinamide formyltransferase [Syntrophaceae bacterium]|nr:phosphoribosylglycinamide formyltransferase [Syntrophaceae bacterium]
MTVRKIAIGALVSGGGTNLQSLIDHCQAGDLDAEIRLVLSNNPDAGALERCRRHGIPSVVLDHRTFASRRAFDLEAVSLLRKAGVELVVLAGFMRILTPAFLQAFPLRVMNIHPALLPSFPGFHAQQQAIDYGVRFSGCTVHFVDEGTDSGPIIIQAVVPVRQGDTAETLAARILIEEHRIYPQAIQNYAEGRIEIRGREVLIREDIPTKAEAFHNTGLTRC